MWLSQERLLRLCSYRSLQSLPHELKNKVIQDNMNCATAYAFVRSIFGSDEEKSEAVRAQEKQVWEELGHFYFEKVVTNGFDFAHECSKNNSDLNTAMEVILQYAFDCCQRIHDDYTSSGFDVSGFEKLEALKDAFHAHVDTLGRSVRSFILADSSTLLHIQDLFDNVCRFVYEHENGKEYLQILEQQGDFKISKFVHMFRHNTPLSTQQDENDFPHYSELKRNIASQYPDELPPFISSVHHLIYMPEDSIYVSHFYLTGEWIDEVRIAYVDIQNNDNALRPYLHIIGKLVMKQLERDGMELEELEANAFLQFSDEERDAMSQEFREGIVTDNDAHFDLQYVGEQNAQYWADVLVGYKGDDRPTFYFTRQVMDDNFTTDFELSIREKNLLEWNELH